MTREEQIRRIEEAIHYAAPGDMLSINELSEEAQRQLHDKAVAALASLEHPPIHIYTPREALLMIRGLVHTVRAGGMSRDLKRQFDEMTLAGLTGREDFLITDRLSDKLAEAHAILGELAETAPGTPEFFALLARAREARVLGPDLEAMIEHRMTRV